MNRFAPFFPLVLALTLAGCSQKDSADKPVKAQAGFSLSDTMLREIKIDTVHPQPVRDELTLSGQIATDGDKTVKVYPLVGGVVEQLSVELGDHVNKGQVLAVIKSGEIADLQNQSSAAGTDLDIARKNLQVAEDQFAAGLASERDVTLARKELQKAQGNVGKSRKQLSVYGVSADGTYELRAPISGFITEKNVTDHMQFNADNVGNLFTVSNLDDVWIMANVFESDISKVKEGYKADVTTLSYPDKHFNGRIDKVFNVLDPESKVMKVRVRLDNPGYMLKPEMYAQIKVENTENQKMLAVPAKSVVFDKDRNFVMVFKDRSHIETREVKVLKTVGDLSYVSSGLHDGDKIIAQNQLLVYDELND
ncbi:MULTISPECIES: efflux RND transporter periplasmic adaptor subunit [Hymenobacter]|uniref:Efflux RND transporter periplasmic adaptor subunit n=1 Tax=Hymenobacter jejuensis TaxID=2502781 RepID=A0A5B7ZUL9_9BACT|nr:MULTISPECIES: efflux RND transporter periplasmic adaptor subunit [Hymenobacter]MBC6989133.1 efflux RND transporter periplasmic adaptor subunit [Hymenobacter sp. BT491]QDA58660.1 efflux RND transporter periplasmic adaptor subunit [Hymenobacter jejuensis]